MNKIKAGTEQTFKSGSRGSSSILTGEELTSKQIKQFMQTSFYLPIDVLKHPEWKVEKIQIITGADFLRYLYGAVIHTFEDKELLSAAHFVAISKRMNVKTGEIYKVAKIWYGSEPK